MSEIAKCERCKEYNAAAVDFRHQATSAQNDYPALEARHDALREAVAWERECDECGNWLHLETTKNTIMSSAPFYDLDEIDDLYFCARAEVDRLIGE